MDLSIGSGSASAASVYPTRSLQRAALEQPEAAAPPLGRSTPRVSDPSSDPVAYSLAVSVALSPSALLALQSVDVASAQEPSEQEGTERSAEDGSRGFTPTTEAAEQRGRNDAGRAGADEEGSPAAAGGDPSRADLIGARTAYRLAASVANSSRSEVQGGVDLAA